MKRFRLRLALAGLTLFSAASTWAQSPDFTLRELTLSATEAIPPLPAPGIFPAQLVLDDDSAESTLGLSSPGGALQFLWFNQFAPTGAPFELRQIWVLFPDDPEFGPGDAVQLVAYQDSNADRADGALRLLALDETIQAADGNTFSVYPLPDPIALAGEKEILLGVVNRFVESGVSPESQPAAFDTGASQGRSWVAIWTGDPPTLPDLPPDQLLLNLDDLQPGNFMIRGFGVDGSAVSVPALDTQGLAALALLLAITACGLLVLRR